MTFFFAFFQAWWSNLSSVFCCLSPLSESHSNWKLSFVKTSSKITPRELTDGTYTCSRQDISADLFDRCSGSLHPPVSLNLLGIENCGSLTFRQWPKSVSCEQQKFCKSQVSNFLWWSCFGHATWEWVFIEFMIGSSRCASLNVMPHYTVWQ